MLLNNLNSLNINIVSDRCFSQMFIHAAVIFNSVADYVIPGTLVLNVGFLVQKFSFVLPHIF